MNTVGLYTRFEAEFTSQQVYANAVQDVSVTVDFSCDNTTVEVDAFWDGEQIWRVRFSPQACGLWTWRSTCSNAGDSGLHLQAGEFQCASVATADLFEQHGSLRVSDDHHYLVHADGTPFFWLGDTAWNGPLKSTEQDWTIFLSDRARKGFNVIQFVATQWISAAGDAEGRPAYLGHDTIVIEPAFFRRLDRRIDSINAFGMVAAPVIAWAAAWNADSAHLNPGNTLSDDQLIVLARYIVSRYGAHEVVWILAGDGIYQGEEAARWCRIGRAAFEGSQRLATIHPGGKLWVANEYRDEPWFHFNGYQSGHWNDDDNSRWINEGPPSVDWNTEPVCPHINLEPCYEGHKAMTGGELIDAQSVRRACYWSLLAGAPAGVTYGAHGVWSWESTPELPLSHPQSGVAPCWRDAMKLPGSESMAHLKAIFVSLEWWRLRPCSQALHMQPGLEQPSLFLSAACSDRRDLAMIYAPEGGCIPLKKGFFDDDMEARCFEPTNGTLLWRKPLHTLWPAFDLGGPDDRLLILTAPGGRHAQELSTSPRR